MISRDPRGRRFGAGFTQRVQVGSLGTLAELPAVLGELYRAGMVRPIRPDKAAKMLRELRKWGASPAAGIGAAAIDRPGAPLLIDELGEVTFGEAEARSNALARRLREAGIGAGDGIAIMCRNHRWFLDATLASAKLGASALYMNTGFAGPQFTGVIAREAPSALIYDEEFHDLLAEARTAGGARLQSFVGWREENGPGEHAAIEDLIAGADSSRLEAPDQPPRFVILTSGTTGMPKGAQRTSPQTLSPLAAMISKLGLTAHGRTVIAAPAFHSWGFSHLQVGIALGSALVLRRRFDPEETLRAIDENRANALVVVPVMAQRILALGPEVIARYDTSSLEVVAASGSALPGPLATEWMDTFGENLYNLYGSTEVAYATIATPAELRAAPGTAGTPPRGSIVKLLGEDGREVPHGEVGRIFVANEMKFEGYTGGGGKEDIGGLLATGDVGHLDAGGRLFVDGRDDDMIVSGGENVFPREVEDLIAEHEAVAEAAVIGVDDAEFGKRLKAFVVLAEGGELDEDALRAHVKSNLANYKVPREVVFMDELPRNPTGKVLKRELADL